MVVFIVDDRCSITLQEHYCYSRCKSVCRYVTKMDCVHTVCQRAMEFYTKMGIDIGNEPQKLLGNPSDW
jgi:hypothetical protein